MGQTVSDIMTTDLVALSGEHSVRDAARRMREANVGAVVVQKHNSLLGIVTDRDLVLRCLALGGDCDETPLSEVCTEDVITLRPDDEVDRAVTVMRDNAIRRIPVVKNGKVVGIVSLGDLALERDPFSALGAISKAAPNNEARWSDPRSSDNSLLERPLLERPLLEKPLLEKNQWDEPSWAERSSSERPSVARTTPTVRLAAVRR